MIQFLSLFSGIGAFEKGLDRLGIDYNLVNYCEIDKYASKSYAAVHNVPESLNLGDITKVDTSKLHNIDMVCYGFPCQDISLSGKQKGLKLVCESCGAEHKIPDHYIKRVKSGERFFCEKCGTELKLTRSGLFFEALRIIEDTKPKVAIAENVKNLTSKKFKEQFDIVLESLETAGYNNYWQVLNAKDYGIPQNRERVFIVSIRKDIDTGHFKFPEPFKLDLRLKDLLEDEVAEKYYMSDKAIDYICATGTKNFSYKPEIDLEIARPLTSTMHKSHRASQDNYVSDAFLKDDIKVEIENGKPCIPIKENTKKGYTEAIEGDSINFEQPNSKTRRGRVGKQVAQTLTTSPQQGTVTNDLRIRKLTPLECWRLMGFDDEDFYKAEKVNSNTQLYKQAGNSIVVDVLEYLFKEIMEVINVKKVEEVKTITYECDDLIDVAALKEKEQGLYEELVRDYPAESATYVFKNKIA
jgi:DNA (cytosine-5)-methyltransferase 1